MRLDQYKPQRGTKNTRKFDAEKRSVPPAVAGGSLPLQTHPLPRTVLTVTYGFSLKSLGTNSIDFKTPSALTFLSVFGR